MSPELRDSLEQLAQWHSSIAEGALVHADRSRHADYAADIRAAIVSADEATKNVTALVAAAQKADDALTDPRIGTWSYMEGSEIYCDFREASEALRAAIDQSNGTKS